MPGNSRELNRRGFIKTSALATGTGLVAGCLGGDGGDGGGGGGGSGDDGDGGMDFPQEAITFVVPFGPGGGFDSYTRLMAKHLEDHVPVDVRVENIEGSGGVVALKQVGNAEPDGYTNMIMWLDGFAVGQALEGADYDLREYTYYPQIANSQQSFHVAADAGIEDWDDYVEAVQNEELVFGVSGYLTGSGSVVPAVVGRATGLYEDVNVAKHLVAFDGKSDFIAAVKRGDVHMMVVSASSANQYVESGDMKRIATMAEEAPSTTPDVPTPEDLGFEQDAIDQIRAIGGNPRVFGGPGGIPDERADYLREKITDTIQSDAFLSDADDSDLSIDYADSEQAAKTAEDLIASWEENGDIIELIKEHN